MKPSKELSWTFNRKKEYREPIVAVRISLLSDDSNVYDPQSDIFIKIPDGGRCSYVPEMRLFTVFDSDDEVFRTIQAPPDYVFDISLIEKQYYEYLEIGQNIPRKVRH